MFNNIDFDEVLDSRDREEFDREWNRVYNDIELLKKANAYSDDDHNICKKYRESAFMRVYEISEDSDLAAYISDDFGLIFDSELLQYTDEWLIWLIQKYEASEIPC